MDRKVQEKLDYFGVEFTPEVVEEQISVKSRDKNDGRKTPPRTPHVKMEDQIMDETTQTTTQNSAPQPTGPVDRVEQQLAAIRSEFAQQNSMKNWRPVAKIALGTAIGTGVVVGAVFGAKALWGQPETK